MAPKFEVKYICYEIKYLNKELKDREVDWWVFSWSSSEQTTYAKKIDRNQVIWRKTLTTYRK